LPINELFEGGLADADEAISGRSIRAECSPSSAKCIRYNFRVIFLAYYFGMSASTAFIQKFAIPKTTNMKKINILRSEHLLLLVPAITYAILHVFCPEIYRYVMLLDGASMLDFYDLLFVQTLFMIITFFMHKLMQVAGTQSLQIKMLHVSASLFLMASITIVFTQIPDVGRQWHNQIFPTPVYERWLSMSYFCVMAMGLFLFLQIGFMVFGIARTILKGKRKTSFTQVSAA
jgi:hypothetical protein